ncbi:MAG: purine-nucleoside phosphorylase [Eubacteriales bacterium]|nr:purine-nucleoside phosphorylase [Eubacteriales bacterium]
MENQEMKRINSCLEQLRARTDFVPEVALVLGSGLGDYAEKVENAISVLYSELPGFPVSTVVGHAGRFVMGTVAGVKVIAMQGRVHYYEGYPIADVVLPIRVMARMGAKVLFLTNASGGVNPDFRAGDLMMIRDHIAIFAPNPLVGPNIEELGTRFPDMTEVYNGALSDCVRAAAKAENVPLHEGVYAQLTGPSFETPAEIRALHVLGADAVGMSTAVEAVAARHAGMRVCGVSCISNQAAGLSAAPLSHEEVQEAANLAAPRFRALVTESLVRIAELLRGENEE